MKASKNLIDRANRHNSYWLDKDDHYWFERLS